MVHGPSQIGDHSMHLLTSCTSAIHYYQQPGQLGERLMADPYKELGEMITDTLVTLTLETDYGTTATQDHLPRRDSNEVGQSNRTQSICTQESDLPSSDQSDPGLGLIEVLTSEAARQPTCEAYTNKLTFIKVIET